MATEIPAGVVTVTSTVPANSAGAVAVIDPEGFRVKLVAGALPKETARGPPRGP